MSATSQPTTFSDLYTDLQNRVRVTTGVTATENQAKRYINTALADMHLGTIERFPWAERYSTIITQPTYSTGTCTITKGSTALTGIGTLWNTNNDFAVANVRTGGKIQIASTGELYEVSSVTSDTALVLATRYVGTSVTAGTYIYFEDEYTLPSDFLRPLDFHRFSDDIPINLISRTDFRRMFGRNIIRGKPTTGCLIDKAPSGNTSPIRKLQLNRAPDVAYLLKFWYYTSNLVVSSAGAAQANFSADTDEPIMPLMYRHIIILHALFNWYRDKKDDARSAEVKAEYNEAMARILSNNEIGDVRPRIQANIGPYQRRAARPYSGASRRFDIGGRFDRMED